MDPTDGPTDSPGEEPPDDRIASERTGPSLDATLRILAHRRRPHVLEHLFGGDDGTATVDELVDAVVRREPYSPSLDRERVATTPHHVHSPKHAAAGIVDDDGEAGRVAARDEIATCEPYVDRLRSDEDPENVTGGLMSAEMVMCRRCGQSVPAVDADGSRAPIPDRRPECDGTEFRDPDTDEIVSSDGGARETADPE